jgi:hypothetical protein
MNMQIRKRHKFPFIKRRNRFLCCCCPELFLRLNFGRMLTILAPNGGKSGVKSMRDFVFEKKAPAIHCLQIA